jgi:DNA primase
LGTHSRQLPESEIARSLLAPDLSDSDLLTRVTAYYHESLKRNPKALQYLQARGLTSPEIIDRFQIGFADRTLGLQLPAKQWKAGREIRGRLIELGLYRATGREHLYGCLTIPILDGYGRVIQLYGRRASTHLKSGEPKHLLVTEARPLWNASALQPGGTAILCASITDALSFHSAGLYQVLATLGTDSFTDAHAQLFSGTSSVVIAFRSDDHRGKEDVGVENNAERSCQGSGLPQLVVAAVVLAELLQLVEILPHPITAAFVSQHVLHEQECR